MGIPEQGEGAKSSETRGVESTGGGDVKDAVNASNDLSRSVPRSGTHPAFVPIRRFKVGSYWVTEYGSADDPKQFPYLLKYSPYQNVHQGAKYPAVLFMSGDFDTRVDPLHARKMTALMQASTGGDKPILLKYDTKSGHSGGKPLNQIDDDADWVGFLLDEVGADRVKSGANGGS